jgi:pimeloyl-ACP methyl ester carboxylesterase
VKAYFLSGIGADQRAFQKIKLPEGYEPVYLDWITPEKDESITNYASRLCELISDDDFILVGLSFGGMVATEIAKVKTPKKIIIISSVACYDELPWYFKKVGRMGLHKIVPIALLKMGTVINRMMGVGTREDKQIVYDFVRTVDPSFIRWSLNAILTWNAHGRIPELVHVHGSKDHLLPCKYTHPDYLIENAGHLMVLNKAEEVNKAIFDALNNRTA